MKVTVTLSANAGVVIAMGGYRIWVDALHTEKQPGFSCVDLPLQKRMLQCDAFKNPDLIVCTHCHPDHFSEDLVAAGKKLWPEATVLLPERKYADQVLVSGNEYVYTLGELTLRFIQLPHEGEQYANCIHYGVLISVKNKHVLLPGDCRTAAIELTKAMQGRNVDLALLNFPWLTLKRGCDFVKGILNPTHVLLYHLPFVSDDSFGYRHAAAKAIEKMPNSQLLWEPLQSIELEI